MTNKNSKWEKRCFFIIGSYLRAIMIPKPNTAFSWMAQLLFHLRMPTPSQKGQARSIWQISSQSTQLNWDFMLLHYAEETAEIWELEK